MSDEAALRKAIQAALAEVYLTPDGAVDWQQTECADASRAMDVLAAAWHALSEPVPAVPQAASSGPTGQVAGGRIACPTCGGTEGLVVGLPGALSCPQCQSGVFAPPGVAEVVALQNAANAYRPAGGCVDAPATADHRIAEAARAWARAVNAWMRHCVDSNDETACPKCDIALGPRADCPQGTALQWAVGKAEDTLREAVGEGSPDA